MSLNRSANASKATPADSSKKIGNNVPDTNSQQCDSIVISEDFVLMAPPDNFKDNNDSDKQINDDDNDTTSAIERNRYVELQKMTQTINLDYLLLSDTVIDHVPAHMEFLFNQYDCSQLKSTEILFNLIYLIALEMGFMNLHHCQSMANVLVQLSSATTYHSKNILLLSQLKPSYISSEDKQRFSLKLKTIVADNSAMHNNDDDETYSLLTAFTTGDFMIVVLSPGTSTGAKGFSICLSLGRYVLSLYAKEKPIYQRFRKLSELALMLRETLFVPRRNHQLQRLGFNVYPALDALPVDVYSDLSKYLTKNQIRILSNVNKNLCSIFGAQAQME